MSKTFNNFVISCIATTGLATAAFMLFGIGWLVQDSSTFILSIIGDVLILLTLMLALLTRRIYGRYLEFRATQGKSPLPGQGLLLLGFYLNYAVLAITLIAGTLGLVPLALLLPGVLIGMAIPLVQLLYVVWQDWIRERPDSNQAILN